jgi:hypothetical protein
MASLQSSESEESQDDKMRFGDWAEDPLSDTGQMRKRYVSPKWWSPGEAYDGGLPWL